MKSFDCWDTIIARRSIVDIYNEENNLFPITENVAKVQPDDIIVSDFYNAPLLDRIVPQITGLHNKIIVTELGKFQGTIWNTLKNNGYSISEHIGDNPYSDVVSPNNNGIKGTLSNPSPFTAIEQEINDCGMKGLARTMRESRLITWHPSLRNLQLIQTQANFPMLFIASILLHRKNPTRILMSSRDCCLWQHIQKIIRDLCGGKYEIVYFKTSRLSCAHPTPSYIQYVNGLMPATLVDIEGSGSSFSCLLNHLHKDMPIVFIVHVPPPNSKIQAFVERQGPSLHMEFANFDRQAMYIDEINTFNPTNIDWSGMKEIEVMHDTFMLACSVVKNYNFVADFGVSDDILYKLLNSCLLKLEQAQETFEFTQSFFMKENDAIMQKYAELARKH